jgi:hypothetical protein
MVEGTLPAAQQSFWMAAASTVEDVRIPGALFAPFSRSPRTERGEVLSVFSQLALGDLVLQDVVARPTSIAALGQSVLSHSPWEIDLDRGTLTLDSPPWQDGAPGAFRLPLRREGPLDIVEIRAGGKPVEMALSTTDSWSRAPFPVGEPADLLEYGLMENGGMFLADTWVGPHHVGRHVYVDWMASDREALWQRPSWMKRYGSLGLDVLALFRFRVVPGRELWLQPRANDVRPSAAERVSRWSWTRGCARPGCVQVELNVQPAQAPDLERPLSVVLHVERAFPRPAALLIACATAAEPVESWWAIFQQRQAHHRGSGDTPSPRSDPYPPVIGISAPVGRTGRFEVPVKSLTLGWDMCSSPLLVDVVPLSDDVQQVPRTWCSASVPSTYPIEQLDSAEIR